MRKTIIILCLFYCKNIYSQLYDSQWALGYDQSVVDFRTTNMVKIDSLHTFIYYITTNASICDEQGNLLYYTNGISICCPNDTLANGSGLSPCPYSDQYAIDGLNIPQAALFIPKPGSTRYYYLFHFSNDTLNETRPATLYYSLIDKEENGGLGSVTSKNVPILKNVKLREGGMTACKHANGRDFWLILGASATNQFYKFLVTPHGILGPYVQNIGPEFPLPGDVAYSKFSQDGTKFATGVYVGPILEMDFDRCSGEFSNALNIYHNASSDPINHPANGAASVEFSSNNEFLYVTNANDLTQYDLSATNIQDSIELYHADTADFYQISYLQMAPNGKVYGSTWNGGLRALHVINRPDLKGDSAGFVYGGQPTYTLNSANLPNLINYRLGPLVGSGCDTITAITALSTGRQGPRVIPNPVDKYAYVEMGMQGNYKFELLNASGRMIDRKETRQVDIFDTEYLPSGAYFLRVIDNTTGVEFATKKVVVAH